MKTLLIKLAGTVDDSSLPTFGELKLGSYFFSSIGSGNFGALNITLATTEDMTIRCDGTGYFSDDTHRTNLGNTLKLTANTEANVKMGISGSRYNLVIPNKYAVKKIAAWYAQYWSGWKLSQFGDMTNLQYLATNITGNSVGAKMTGDLSDLAALQNLAYLSFTGETAITGKITDLLNLPNVSTVNLKGASLITGNTSEIASMHPNNGGKLGNFQYSGTAITGEWPPA